MPRPWHVVTAQTPDGPEPPVCFESRSKAEEHKRWHESYPGHSARIIERDGPMLEGDNRPATLMGWLAMIWRG